MNQTSTPEPLALPPGTSRARVTVTRRSLLLSLFVTFVSGVVIGLATGAFVTRARFLEALNQPGRLPDRLVPMLRARLGLDDRQTAAVSEIIRARHFELERIRSESYPRYLAEFEAIEDEISMVLDDDQRKHWRSIWRSARDRFMPAPPSNGQE